MNFPVQVFHDPDQTGIRISIHHFQGSESRISSENILLLELKHSLQVRRQNKEFSLHERDLFFLPAGYPLQYSGEDAYALLLEIPGVSIRNYNHQIFLDSHLNPNLPAYDQLREIIFQILSGIADADSFSEYLLQSFLQKILFLLLHHFLNPAVSEETSFLSTHRTEAPDLEDAGFLSILRFIDNNYFDNIQLKELAHTYYYTPSHLSKLFLKNTGLHFKEYLNEKRLSHSLSMLKTTNYSIQIISDRCGFPNVRAFQQTFQEKYRMRPSDYRKTLLTESHDLTKEEQAAAVRELMNAGMFNSIAVTTDTVHIKTDEEDNIRYNANISVSAKEGSYTDISQKNSTLCIYRFSDLILKKTQEQVRTVQKAGKYRYLYTNCFLADNMQTIYISHIASDFKTNPRNQWEYSYNFNLYQEIFSFMEDTGLEPVLALDFVPSALARDTLTYDVVYNSCITLPYSMDEWRHFIAAVLSFMKSHFPALFARSHFLFWTVPDFHVAHSENLTKEEFFHLYQCTYEVLREVCPEQILGSPAISCTHAGLQFMKEFLDFCIRENCIPDRLYFVNYYQSTSQYQFQEPFVSSRAYISELRQFIGQHKELGNPSFHLAEYTYGFGKNAQADGMIRAGFLIDFTMEQFDLFDDLGYTYALDYSVNYAIGEDPFCGMNGLLNKDGIPKADFFSMHYLSELGDYILGKTDCAIVTRTKNSIRILFRYVPSVTEWKRSFTNETALRFYEDFPDKRVTMEITDLEVSGRKELLMQERFLNHLQGSPYEEWLRSSPDLWKRKAYSDRDLPVLGNGGFEIVRNKMLCLDDNHVLYECVMKPFEIRFVEIYL